MLAEVVRPRLGKDQRGGKAIIKLGIDEEVSVQELRFRCRRQR
jgi:hypothetical protein